MTLGSVQYRRLAAGLAGKINAPDGRGCCPKIGTSPPFAFSLVGRERQRDYARHWPIIMAIPGGGRSPAHSRERRSKSGQASHANNKQCCRIIEI